MDPLDFQKNTEVDGCCFDHTQRYTLVPVPESGGCVDFGRIPDDVAVATGMLPLPVRLSNGEHRWPNNGFGARHILVQHGRALADADYYSVQDFVLETVKYFDAVYASHTGRWQLVLRPNEELPDYRVLVIQRYKEQNYYSVVTGWLREGNRPIKDTLVWERRDRPPEPGGFSPPK